MADLRRLHPRLTETDLDTEPFIPELSPVVTPYGDSLMTRPWLDWARRLTLLVGIKSSGGGGTGTGDVVGPNGATPDAIAIYSGSTGKLIKDSLTSIGSVISQAVSQAIAAILPGGKLPLSNLPLHKTTHQTGGTDAVDVKLLAGYPGNNTQYLNGVGAFATPPGADLDYLGGYAPATYNDGDIVVAVDGIAYMCVKDGTTTPPEAWPGGAPLLAAHHVTHEPGGSDPMAVDAAVATGSLRTIGTGPLQAAAGNDTRFTNARVPTAHAPTHSTGGTDPVTVTALAGYPGGTANFLRADGTFAAPPATVPGAHHTTHEPGGSDALVNAAWVNLKNTFSDYQTIAYASPVLVLRDTTPAANSRVFYVTNSLQKLTLASSNDDFSGSVGGFVLDRAGNATVGNNLTAIGSGGNVACKDQTNTFTTIQTIAHATVPQLVFSETGQAANLRNIRIVGNSQQLLVQGMNDAGTALSTPLAVNRAGQVTVQGDIYEKNRTTPIGHWINVAFNAANFVGFSPGSISRNAYQIVGKTVTWQLSFTGGTVGAFAPDLTLVAPVPPAPTGYAGGAAGHSYYNSAYGPSIQWIKVTGSTQIALRNPVYATGFTAGSPLECFVTIIYEIP